MSPNRLRLVAALCLFALATACAAPQAPAAEEARRGDAVDYTCAVDADCTVKNVGNCCGYYPACVNKDSPTFPERVQARCEAEGMASICGFPQISGCACVEGRCSNLTGPTGRLIEEER